MENERDSVNQTHNPKQDININKQNFHIQVESERVKINDKSYILGSSKLRKLL